MHYSDTIGFLVLSIWMVGSALLASYVRSVFYAYIGSVVLSTPLIGYSMALNGLLPMGGILHALWAGIFVLPIHFICQRYIKKKSN
jgi:MFS-type transporter involved in bile tolerance (Atg22 family)